MPAVVDIESPLPGDAIGLTFHVIGTLDLRNYRLGLTPEQLLTSPGDLYCNVYQSDGTTNLPNTTITPANPWPVPGSQDIVRFDFTVTKTGADAIDCVVRVMFVPTGTAIGNCTPQTCPRDIVEEFDLLDEASAS